MAPPGSIDCDCVFVLMALFGYRCSGNKCPVDNDDEFTPIRPTPVGPVPIDPTPPASISEPTDPEAKSGLMTMWTNSLIVVTGSSCQYADAAIMAGGSTPWLDPYVEQHRYCAVNDALYQAGMGCGSSFEIPFAGEGGTDPGRPGSAVIQVVDSGSAKEFDCFLAAFEDITGSNIGIFPISYSEVPCEVTGLSAIILDGNNAWYVKVLFAGGPTGVEEAALEVGSTTHNMERVSVATWEANLAGVEDQAITFYVTFSDGSHSTISDCFGGTWPVATSSQCS